MSNGTTPVYAFNMDIETILLRGLTLYKYQYLVHCFHTFIFLSLVLESKAEYYTSWRHFSVYSI